MISYIVQCANNPTPARSSLAKLEEIIIGDVNITESSPRQFVYVHNVLPLVNIHSVHSLYGSNVLLIHVESDYPSPEVMRNLRNPGFKELKLQYSVFNYLLLKEFLSHTPKLERFYLSWDKKKWLGWAKCSTQVPAWLFCKMPSETPSRSCFSWKNGPNSSSTQLVST